MVYQVWRNSPHISKLFGMQKRAIRIINRKSYKSHTEPLFKSEKILKIDDLYKLHVLLFMHDFKHKKLPSSFNDFAISNNINVHRITCQSNLFHTGRPRTNYSLKLPNHSFPRIWNSFDQEIVQIGSKNIFKNKCKINFLNNYTDALIK